MVDSSKLNLFTPANIDKIPFADTLEREVQAATDSGGGFYLPETDTLTIPNPYGRKALLTMAWSIDNVNFYPQKPVLYNPGVWGTYDSPGATAGGAVDDDNIYFYFTHYRPSATTFYVRWALDTIT